MRGSSRRRLGMVLGCHLCSRRVHLCRHPLAACQGMSRGVAMAKRLCIGWHFIWAASLHASPSNEQLRRVLFDAGSNPCSRPPAPLQAGPLPRTWSRQDSYGMFLSSGRIPAPPGCTHRVRGGPNGLRRTQHLGGIGKSAPHPRQAPSALPPCTGPSENRGIEVNAVRGVPARQEGAAHSVRLRMPSRLAASLLRSALSYSSQCPARGRSISPRRR